MVLSDHISKEMNELNLIRCQRIPRRAGADWRDLPDEKVSKTQYFYFYFFEVKGLKRGTSKLFR